MLECSRIGRTVSNWIKVADQKPTPMVPVLIAWAGHPAVKLGWRIGDFWFDRFGPSGWMPPTHWMPLPEPPKLIDPESDA